MSISMQHGFRAGAASTGQTSRANIDSQELYVCVACKPGSHAEFLNRFKYICCLMGYVVDLTLILQVVFRASLEEGKITTDRVNDIIYEFVCSGKKDSIHNAITAFLGDQHLPAKGDMVNKNRSLIEENEVRDSLLRCQSID